MSKILTPKDIAIIQIGLQTVIDDMEEVNKNPGKYPFNPEAIKDQKDILYSARSVLNKIQSLSGMSLRMDPYKPGDEKEFFTKES